VLLWAFNKQARWYIIINIISSLVRALFFVHEVLCESVISDLRSCLRTL